MVHTETMATVTIRDIPRDQHKAMKLWCVENEVSLNTLLLGLINEFVEREAATVASLQATVKK